MAAQNFSAVMVNTTCSAVGCLFSAQITILQSGRVGPEFFSALSRVRAIHEHCKGLLRSHHQRAGLELMDQMSAHQEAAYEHLCRSATLLQISGFVSNISMCSLVLVDQYKGTIQLLMHTSTGHWIQHLGGWI